MATPPASRTREFHLDLAAEQAILLFTAEGERRWAAGWDPAILSGLDERGSVFVTHAGTDRATHWIVTAFDPAAGRIAYARLVDGSNFGLVEVRCCPAPQGGTSVSVRYTLTPLGDEGARFVARFLEPAHFDAMIDGWKTAIDQALAAAPAR